MNDEKAKLLFSEYDSPPLDTQWVVVYKLEVSAEYAFDDGFGMNFIW